MCRRWKAVHDRNRTIKRNELGSIPHELKDIIFSQPDLDILKKWLRLAAKAESIEEFKSMISL